MSSRDPEDVEKKMKNLNLTQKVDINILLLGETGVGKSTFINSVANYLTYDDLKTAKKQDLIVLIPTEFSLQDKNGEFHVVSIGNEDNNEFLDLGVSATQDVKTYVFPIRNGKARVRLIDTPGMGDTRGVKQDDINSENILTYISQLNELHAICFLFRPNQTRNTVFFRYCMSQILSRLDKSASKNIIFAFTNTRGSDYGPGDTMNLLKKEVESIRAKQPQADIPIDKNIFCFDNETFRYLAAAKNKVKFDDSVKERNKESWKNSSAQCWKLINYILGDAQNPPLKPHQVKSTSAINEARRMIQQLAQPLAEISQLINSNVNALQRHKVNMELDNQSLEELKSKLYMPVISLEVIRLTQPVTVCTSRKCADIYKVGGENKWHYKQRCHDPCYLRNVPKEIIGAPELLHCEAMAGTENCTRCRCHFNIHMHVYYMTKTKEDREVDPNIEKNITSKEALVENMRKIMRLMVDKREELDSEHQTIITVCARFAHFLQNNAITPFSDSYKEYIEYLITREKSLGKMCDTKVVDHLQTLLREYEETKRSFEKALEMNLKIGNTEQIVSPKDISDSLQQLFNLKHNGKKIKELYECQKKARSKEHANTEYVHAISQKVEEKNVTSERRNNNERGNSGDNRNRQQSGGGGGNRNRQQNWQQNRGNDNTTRNNQQRPSHDAPPAYNDIHRPQYPSQQASGPYPHGYYPPPLMGSAYAPPRPDNAYGPPSSYGPGYGHPPTRIDPYNYGQDYQHPQGAYRDGRPEYDINITVNRPGDSPRSPQTPDTHYQFPPPAPKYVPSYSPPAPYYHLTPTYVYGVPPMGNPHDASGSNHRHGVHHNPQERRNVNNSRSDYDQGRSAPRGRRGGINERNRKRNVRNNGSSNGSEDSDS